MGTGARGLPEKHSLKGWSEPGGLCGGMIELNEHLARVQDIANRAQTFQDNQASEPEAFSKAVVGDLGALADAVAELIKRAEV